MFTGIISHLGTFVGKKSSTLTFRATPEFFSMLDESASVAVNGICLTVTKKEAPDMFSFAVMPETEKKTMLHTLKEGSIVNLELPVTPQTLLSGHIVQGHVDGVGKLVKIVSEGNSHILSVEVPDYLSKYITDKGSIAMNGISLTVIAVERNIFTVGIIPYTWEHTMLHTIVVGYEVNIETDVIAKYVERLLMKK